MSVATMGTPRTHSLRENMEDAMRLDDEQDDPLELDNEIDEQDDQPTDNDDDQQDDESEGDDNGADETLIGFEDEEPLQVEPENSTIRRLRESLDAEKKRRKAAEARAPKVEVGDKPTLESVDYDEERYDTELDAWKARKAEAEQQAANSAQNGDGDLAEESKTAHVEYTEQKAKLARPDFAQAETAVEAALSTGQQGVLVMASKNKAALVYALGKSPERLNALAEIKNPIKLAIAVADMERNLKVQARRKGAEPEGRMRGGTPNNESGDKKLARLEKDADRTGDRSALIRYKASLNRKG